MTALSIEHVNEVHVELNLGANNAARTMLRDLERFCEALRRAGADGALPVHLHRQASNDLALVAVVKDLPTASET